MMRNLRGVGFSIFVITICQGCFTSRTYYVAKGQAGMINGFQPLRKDSLNINCMRYIFDSKRLDLELGFNRYSQQVRVKDILIKVRDKMHGNLELENIYMVPGSTSDPVFFRASHSGPTFSALPNAYKFTKYEGSTMYYNFRYRSPVVIKTRYLDISFLVQLENGQTVNFSERFLRRKQYSLAFH